VQERWSQKERSRAQRAPHTRKVSACAACASGGSVVMTAVLTVDWWFRESEGVRSSCLLTWQLQVKEDASTLAHTDAVVRQPAIKRLSSLTR